VMDDHDVHAGLLMSYDLLSIRAPVSPFAFAAPMSRDGEIHRVGGRLEEVPDAAGEVAF
jgi:hypothetical protein